MDLEESPVTRPFLRRSDSSFDADDLPLHFQKAAALVCQSLAGHHMPPQVVENENYERAKKAFLLYKRLKMIRIIVIVVLILLPFFQEPYWIKRRRNHGYEDLTGFPVSGINYMSPYLLLVIKVSCFAPLTFSMFLQYRFWGFKMWTNKVSILKAFCLVGMAVGILQTLLEICGFSFFDAVDISSYAHVFVPLIFQRTLRRAFFMSVKIVRDFTDAAVLVAIFLLLSACIATSLFSNCDSFRNLPSSLLSLFILLTTSNSPDVWAPVYSENQASFFFFMFYMIIGVFFLLNMTFSVIYGSFKIQMEIEIRNRVVTLNENLQQAFNLLDVEKKGWIDAKTMTKLFLAIFIYRGTPDDRYQRLRLFLALDKRGDFKISNEEFENVCNLISSEVDGNQDEPSACKLGSYISGFDSLQFVLLPIFRFAVWCVTIIGAIFVYYGTYVNSSGISAVASQYMFGLFLVVDDTLKILAMGWKCYWDKALNRFSFYVSLTCMIIMIMSLTFLPGARQWIYLCLIAQVLCIFTNFEPFSRWLLMFETLTKLLPATLPTLNVQFSLCSFFALLGLQFFGGLIYQDNPALAGTTYSDLELFSINFNDYASAMVTNFCLCIVNNWFVIMDAYVAVTGKVWARLYFLAFWALVVALTLNISIAFFVEAYLSQFQKIYRERVSAGSKSQECAGSKSQESGSRLYRIRYGRHSLSCYDLYADLVHS